MKYVSPMKTLTVQEASQNLGRWLRRAMGGEQIAIHEGGCVVLLPPLAALPESPASERMTACEALRRLQFQQRSPPPKLKTTFAIQDAICHSLGGVLARAQAPT